MSKTSKITFRLSPGSRREIKKLAKSEKRKEGDYCRFVLEQHVDQRLAEIGGKKAQN